MSRWPIRLRLTAAFALALLAVLACAAAFVYVRVRADLDASLRESLTATADAVAARVAAGDAAPAAGIGDFDAEEVFAVVLTPSGRVVDASGGGGGRSVVATADVSGPDPLVFDARVPGVEGTARVLARRAPEAAGNPIVAVGRSLDDRDETLAGLLAAFAIGGPVAIAVASLVGYLLAATGLAPVEAMRRRAEEVTLDGDPVSLPLPRADDEVRRLGATLNAMLDRLRRSFERERAFVADASHELRTPLAVLKTEIEAAVRSGDYGPKAGASLRAALDECDHLALLADDLLLLARTGDGGLPLHREALEVPGVLGDLRERFAVRAERDERPLDVVAEPGLTVRADSLRIRQAMGNLVDNALRHGTGAVELRGRRAGASVELAVADAGEGFDAGLADIAFERFTRGDAARTRGGAGLGLAIVRAIARAHGGEAGVGRGGESVVWIRLPAP